MKITTTRQRPRRFGFHNTGRFASLIAGACLATGLLAGVPVGTATASAGVVEMAASATDRVVLRSGRVVEGTILEETPTGIVMEVQVAGIRGKASYTRTEILEIQRGSELPEIGGGNTEDDTGPSLDELRQRLSGEENKPLTEAELGAPSVYHMVLKGWFGTDIHPIVVKDMLDDARDARPDYLIVEIDRSWQEDVFTEALDDLGNGAKFDEFTTADEIEALFTKEMPRTWEKIPHVVVWVKGAMGGAAFLPFIGDEIYFHPNGRMGGIGNLGEMFDGVGDHVVRQKQRSLRLARAQGIAIAGGYDYRIVTAMSMRKYQLSYRLEGGVAVLFEGLPGAGKPNEFKLTEDGTIDANRDRVQDVIRGISDDVLTLKAETAKTLAISRGTAESFEDVLSGMGVLRNHRIIDGRADRLGESWSRRLDQIAIDLPRMWAEFNEIAVGQNGVRDERSAIARRERALREIRSLLVQYQDAIRVPEGLGRGARPAPAQFVPPLPQIEIMLEQLSVQRRTIDL